jgi:hypothetical protein
LSSGKPLTDGQTVPAEGLGGAVSDWLRADDYTTLDQVFASPDFAREDPPEVPTAEPVLLATAAPAATVATTTRPPLVRSLRDRAIASLCAAGAAVSVVGALIVGNGPIGVPLAGPPPGAQSGGQSGQTPTTQIGSPSQAGAAGGQPAADTGSAPAGSVVVGPPLPTAAGTSQHASLVAATFPAPTTTTVPGSAAPVKAPLTTPRTAPSPAVAGANSGPGAGGPGNGGQNHGHGSGEVSGPVNQDHGPGNSGGGHGPGSGEVSGPVNQDHGPGNSGGGHGPGGH